MARLLAVVVLLSALAAGRAVAQVPMPDEARHVGQPVPDITVRSLRGSLSLSDLWRQGPVVLTLVFTRCAGVCSPYLQSLRAADAALGAPADLRRVVLSFDPRDTEEDMARSAGHLGVGDRRDWWFGVASAADIDRLARAFGFTWEWDPAREQFDHPAMLAGIREGRLVRLLVGVPLTTARLGEVVREVRGQFVASYPAPGAVRFRCFDYDPLTGRATLGPGFVILLVPALVAAVGTWGLFWRRNRQIPNPNSQTPMKSQ